MADACEPITDDEELYRRIPVSQNYYDPSIPEPPSPKAFRPRESDETGLSIQRAKFASEEEICTNDRGSRYYVAVLRAADLRARGIEVVSRPLSGNPGHAELPQLRYENRRNPEPEELQVMLARELCVRVVGPFP